MKFSIKAMKDDEGTFSAEGVYAFLSHYIDWTNKTFSQILAHGFKTGEIVKELVIETSWTVNGKPVSEEVLDLFTVYDECGHIVKDFDGAVDIEIEGEDCESIIEVDSHTSIDPPSGQEFACLLHKVVVDNCGIEPEKKRTL